MQVKPQEVSADKATTPGRRTRPTLASHNLHLPSICDICGGARSTGKHAKCSRTRQQTKQAEYPPSWPNWPPNASPNRSAAAMTVEIRCRYATGTYVATVKGEKRTASNTISARHAAEAMAVKLGLDPAHLVEKQRDLIDPKDRVIFTHPGEPV